MVREECAAVIQQALEPMQQKWVGVEAVASHAGTSVKTIRRWDNRGPAGDASRACLPILAHRGRHVPRAAPREMQDVTFAGISARRMKRPRGALTPEAMTKQERILPDDTRK
jgi:hypothetical protein